LIWGYLRLNGRAGVSIRGKKTIILQFQLVATDTTGIMKIAGSVLVPLWQKPLNFIYIEGYDPPNQ